MTTNGYSLDFNDGARLRVPAGNYHVRFTDLDTMNVLFESDFSDAVASSTKKYYIRFCVELWKDGQLILTHEQNGKINNHRSEEADLLLGVIDAPKMRRAKNLESVKNLSSGYLSALSGYIGYWGEKSAEKLNGSDITELKKLFKKRS